MLISETTELASMQLVLKFLGRVGENWTHVILNVQQSIPWFLL